MAPSPSVEPAISGPEAELLLDLAEQSILDGLRGCPPQRPRRADLPPALQEPRGAFVTLMVDGTLNGCIGTIEGMEPLGDAVPRLAWQSAFADPRLPALRPADWDGLSIEISVLSPLSPMPASTREELLGQLRPGVDGLVIAAGSRQAVFLPAVWAQLPEPVGFLEHLLRKAGLPVDGWPRAMRAYRFTAEKLSRP